MRANAHLANATTPQRIGLFRIFHLGTCKQNLAHDNNNC